MQFFDITEQLKINLFAVVLGCISGLIYDIIRVCRLLLFYGGKNKFLRSAYDFICVQITDVVYMMLESVSFCIFLFYFNNGHFRWYLLFALICGFVCYSYSIGYLVRKSSVYITELLRTIIRLVVVVPVTKLLQLLKIILSPVKACILYCFGLSITERIKKRYFKEFEV